MPPQTAVLNNALFLIYVNAFRALISNLYHISTIRWKSGRKAFNKGMKNIDEGPETENDATENSLTSILNDLEGPLEDFSENFIDDILGSPSAFFDTAISGWSNFEDFFSR
nr:CNT_HP1_G0029890.mRNA.1.CDS.1 [Saccharomyces cerevisiae]